MSPKKSPPATNLHGISLPQNANFIQNKTIAAIDTYTCLTLLTVLLLLFDGVVILLFPAIMFFAMRGSDTVKRVIWRERKIPPLPKDIRSCIKEHIHVPKNIFFMRSDKSDPQSISLFFVHIILLPEHFENDLKNPHTQAKLLHEFGHSNFADYLMVNWVFFIGSLAVMITLEYFTGILNLRSVETLISRDGLEASVAFLAILSLLNISGMYHRREHNADFTAFFEKPEILKSYLRLQRKKSERFKFRWEQFDVLVVNWFYHPSAKRRLEIITGARKFSAWGVLFPAIIAGFLPVFLVLNLGVIVLHGLSPIALVSAPISIFCLVQFGVTLNSVFGRLSIFRLGQKAVFAFGLLLGMYLFTFVFGYASNPDRGGDFTITAINGANTTHSLAFMLFSILSGYALFLVFILTTAKLFKKTLSAAICFFLMPFPILIAQGGLMMTEMEQPVSLEAKLQFFTMTIAGTLSLFFLLELLFQIAFAAWRGVNIRSR